MRAVARGSMRSPFATSCRSPRLTPQLSVVADDRRGRRGEIMVLFDERKLAEAVTVHEACYGLLGWLASAVDRGFVRSTMAHGYMNDVEAAATWIGDHFTNIPPSFRPA